MSPLDAGLRQPDARSCGAAALTMARALRDASYAARVVDPATFAREVLARHRRLTALRDPAGRWQVPWPRAIGTPPWAVARELGELTGTRHHTRLVRWSRSTTAPPSGALYVGSRWLPRHVVLVLDGRDEDLPRCYEPASGRVLPLEGRPLAGWRHRWLTVAP